MNILLALNALKNFKNTPKQIKYFNRNLPWTVDNCLINDRSHWSIREVMSRSPLRKNLVLTRFFTIIKVSFGLNKKNTIKLNSVIKVIQNELDRALILMVSFFFVYSYLQLALTAIKASLICGISNSVTPANCPSPQPSR